ncbi:MAG: hypothetical protein JWM90_2413 [Thermoleophilia bacterium]|nr:hypothetical protein [Thermoleophilia bacterium]
MDQGTQGLIKRHNERTRDLIVRDIDALENKLNVRRQVSNIAEDAVGKVKGTLGMNQGQPGEGWGGFVRHNIAPLIAMGLGGTVLARNLKARGDDAAPPRSISTYDPTRSSVSSGDGMRHESGDSMMGSAQSKVSHAGSAVTGQVSHAKEAIVDHIPSRTQAKVAVREHSHLLGLGALAIGAVAGSFIPRSQAEQEKLAPVQEQVKEKASQLVSDTVDKAQETVERATEAISAGAEKAKEEFAGEQSDDASGMPDLTTPNRITGNRTPAASSIDREV